MKIVKVEDIENPIITLRSEGVLLDAELADVYGIATKEVNQAVANNPEKFPVDYVVELTAEEKQEVVKKFDHIAKLKFSPDLPKAFTEKGLYMLATILKSRQAVQTTLAIIGTFTKIRHLSRTLNELAVTDDEARQKALIQKSGEIIAKSWPMNLRSLIQKPRLNSTWLF